MFVGPVSPKEGKGSRNVWQFVAVLFCLFSPPYPPCPDDVGVDERTFKLA